MSKSELKKKAFDKKYMPSVTRIYLPETCPECGDFLKANYILITDWPYVHTDLQLECVKCDFSALYGIPLDRLAGMTLQILDSDPLGKNYGKIRDLEQPVCPFHKEKMLLTKIFGNLAIPKKDRFRVQFKCPKCYVTKHVDGSFVKKHKKSLEKFGDERK